MIYYYSGTGNSAWVARELARQLKDEARAIQKMMQEEGEISVAAGQICGIVFPIHAWAPPLMVEEFCRRIKLQPGAYCFAVCTCASQAGDMKKYLARLLPLNALWSLAMPNNYITMPGFDVEQPQAIEEKIAAARQSIAAIAPQVAQRQSVFAVHSGALPFFLQRIANRGFRKHWMNNGRRFTVDDSCNGCGICAKRCPEGNIRLEAGKPFWGDHCSQCQACISYCPQRAIQFAKLTQQKGRYVFPEQE
jgi:ferredoxin